MNLNAYQRQWLGNLRDDFVAAIVVACDVNDFDRIYRRLIYGAYLKAVMSCIAMEAIAD